MDDKMTIEAEDLNRTRGDKQQRSKTRRRMPFCRLLYRKNLRNRKQEIIRQALDSLAADVKAAVGAMLLVDDSIVEIKTP